jgi:hypothetical protein
MQIRGGLRRKLALILMLATPAGLGLPWSPRQESSSLKHAPLPMPLTLPAQAVADFDGDRLPDRAELVSDGFQKNIQLTLSSKWAPSLHFSSETQEPGSIYAEDIDRDSDDDLIWVSDGQSTHTALWLNNGIGELERVSDPSAYATEIKRLVAGGNRNGSLASSSSGRLRATAASGFYLPAQPDDHLPEAPHSNSLKNPRRGSAAALSPCVSRYPKRGPPSFSHELIGFRG